MKFSIRAFFGKCDQIRSLPTVYLLKKSLVENFTFCAVHYIAQYSGAYYLCMIVSYDCMIVYYHCMILSLYLSIIV